ncbi:hypothetical protein K8B33_13510 [Alcanivorax sp. JB21]|uniref:hypothetical protein n=1 Tax=Alcanivorax limicola TaxID=2874102 RepID=UPI001CBCBF9B|nr:hypothetical protein [Alcanivorax limicola]MBZ2190120.1 hypothetical protein [Alcanivorax limicola]
MAIVLDNLTVPQLREVIADAEVLLRKRREQQARELEAQTRAQAQAQAQAAAPRTIDRSRLGEGLRRQSKGDSHAG